MWEMLNRDSFLLLDIRLGCYFIDGLMMSNVGRIVNDFVDLLFVALR